MSPDPARFPAQERAPFAILISGRGSNMKALLAAARRPDYPARCVLVLADRPEAAGLAVAQEKGVPVALVNHRAHETRDGFEKELDRRLREAGAELLCLAGFMRILSARFVARWEGRMLNIHPSLLPRFPGTNTHARALASRVCEHGCTVHLVTDALDSGPILMQASVPVLKDDDAQTLGARVLEEEHRLFPRALRCFIERRRMDG